MKCITLLTLCTVVLVNAYDLYNFNGNTIKSIIADMHYPPPPPVDEIAKMARYVVHYSDWCVVSIISHQKSMNISGLPRGRIFSMSDGPLDNSSGIPYIYSSFLDDVTRDLKTDGTCSFSVTLAQGSYCSQKRYDPEDPRCAQVLLMGKYIFLQNNTKEWEFAKKALFTRHPAMKDWPPRHHFVFGKLNITKIILLDYFGGKRYPSVQDYFNVKPIQGVEKSVLVEMV